MSQLARIVNRNQVAEAVEARERQELGEGIHKAWVFDLSNLYAKYIRLYEDAERADAKHVLHAEPSKEWLLGAYTLLCFGATEAKHAFLTGSEKQRDRIVDAIQQDSGVTDEFGRWKEILP